MQNTGPDFWHQEAEQAVIGACLKACVNGNTLPLEETREILKPGSFYRPEHRVLWATLLGLLDAEQTINPMAIQSALEAQGKDSPRQYMVLALELIPAACSLAGISSHAEIIQRDALRRDVLSLSQSLHQQAQDLGQPAQQLANQAAEQLLAMTPTADNSLKSAHDLANDFTRLLLDRQEGKTSPMGLSTSLKDLDQKTLGLHPGQLVIVAGRPGMGKTTLAMNWMLDTMTTRPVLFASLEMSAQQLTERLVSMLAQVDGRKLKDPEGLFSPNARPLEENEFDRVTLAMGQLKTSQLELLDKPGLTVNQLRARAKKLNQKHQDQGGLALIVLDYLQLMGSDSTRKENRTLEVSEQTRALKNLARELGCPVVCLSQLSRDVEKRTNKRPIPADLRDSGSIEQDADMILFIYREEIYQPETPFKGVAELILAKNREGEPGTVYTRASLHQYRFSDLDAETLARMSQDQQASRNTGFQL
jgi:replicative DNA helicase